MIELDDLRDYLGVPPEEHGDDAIIEELERHAVAKVESITGITYPANGTIIEYVKGYGTSDLFLHFNPTADPTEVLERATPGGDSTAITAGQSDGWVRRDSRLVRKGGSVWTLDYEYAVTYAGGFAATTYPDNVRSAVMQITALLYRQRASEGMKSETIGGYSYTRDDEGGIQKIIDMLPRRPVLA